MKSSRFFICFLLLTFSQRVVGQYNFIIDSLIKNPNYVKMIVVNGKFNLEPHDKEKRIRIYDYSNKTVKIKYFEADNNQCDAIKVFGKKFNMNGKFKFNLACNLDITSFRIFIFNFSGKQYLLISSINDGSGDETTYIIFHLFDISNRKDIKYYPLWSIYGSTSCFGDFNYNGKLDFLRIRNNWRQTGENTYKVTLEELNITNSKFNPCDSNKYIIFKKWYSTNDELKIKDLSKNWFHKKNKTR